MERWQKIGLLVLSLAVLAIVSFHAWKSCTHEPIKQDQVDSLQVLRDHAKARANDNKNKGDSENQLYVQDLKKYNSPADSVERAGVWAEYWNSVTADTNGKGAIR